jgi:murein DD-endopeptidase MepM/ murein hydrolase activator NlpD/predicted chitinase
MNDFNSILKSFNIQDNLNPKFWKKSEKDETTKLNPEIRKRLLEIAHQFIEFLKVDIVVSDIIITGSISNYNWSKFSDIDLHIMADFGQFPKKTLPLYEELFKLKKAVFNDKHDIKIYGYDVELYVQDDTESHTSTGIYSVLNDEWVIEPKKEDFKVNKELIKEKSKQWMDIIDSVIESAKDENLEDAKKIITKYKEKLKKYRSCGLEKGGEYSDENLVFKVLRRNGYVEKLFDFDNKNMDDKLTLKEAVLNRPIDSWNITSPYGPRWGKQHHGIDLGTPSGTEIKSPSDGVVLDAAFKDGACGGTIYIDHENGYKTRYCHAKEINVSKGDRVKSGEVIGLTGGGKDDKGRGNSQGAHLHFEMYKDGKIVDPQSIEYSKELVYSTDEVKDEEKLKTIDIVKTLIDKRQEFKDKTIDDVLNTYESSKFLANFIEIPQKNKTYENMRKYGKISFDEDVKKIQEALQYLGFSLPKWGIDGLFGPETEKAVKDFEKKYDLKNDGKVDGEDIKYIISLLLLKGFKDVELGELKYDSETTINGDVDFSKAGFNSTQIGNINLIIDEMKNKGITNPYTQIGILSVIGKESDFKSFKEMSYSNTSNSRIRQIFGNRVSKYSDSELNDFKKDDSKFFDLVYGKDSGVKLGNNRPGDGWKYIGRGFNGITGKSNYKKYGDAVGIDLVSNPELLEDPKVAAKAAVSYFTKNKSVSEIPNFNNKDESIKYFSDINAGGQSSWALGKAKESGDRFEIA